MENLEPAAGLAFHLLLSWSLRQLRARDVFTFHIEKVFYVYREQFGCVQQGEKTTFTLQSICVAQFAELGMTTPALRQKVMKGTPVLDE